MNKEIIDYICSLHGYLIRLKEIHWSTDSDATHTLCDMIMSDVGDLEDRFAESVMGYYGEKIKVGDLMPLLPNSEELIPMLKEMEDDTNKMKKQFNKEDNGGQIRVLNSLLEKINKYKYKATQK